MGNNNSDNGMILLGGLWLNTSQNGNKYMSGRLGLGGKLLIFKNTNKTTDNQPDYMLYLAKQPERAADGETDTEIEF